MSYKVLEDIIFDERFKETKFSVDIDKKKYNFVCNCHMFEFKGIICKHMVTVLIRDGIISLPDKYILGWWRRDVSRSYTRVKINYNGWISTLSQLRYDKLCSVFAKLVDLVVDDEDSTQATMEWMESQLTALRKSNTKPSCGSNIHVEDSVQEQFLDAREAATA
ncbi:protein FAR1-RELATED SEQUENCE 1-like [Diospyros lotus]|uniref:protein FAR1-RELATED SEQUENCE 1-like n=1 Tax=Diospyros lotus TaxID=55363 RepID=UPI00224FC12D|nr:protein FAR1-RELATED SEQUENCE 1-like [Diospyros lotus]